MAVKSKRAKLICRKCAWRIRAVKPLTIAQTKIMDICVPRSNCLLTIYMKPVPLTKVYLLYIGLGVILYYWLIIKSKSDHFNNVCIYSTISTSTPNSTSKHRYILDIISWCKIWNYLIHVHHILWIYLLLISRESESCRRCRYDLFRLWN